MAFFTCERLATFAGQKVQHGPCTATQSASLAHATDAAGAAVGLSDAGDSATGTLADGSGAASSTGTSVLHAQSSASAAAIAGLIVRTIAPP